MKDRNKPRWCRRGAESDFHILRVSGAVMIGLSWAMVFVLSHIIYDDPWPPRLIWSVFLVGFVAMLCQSSFQYADQREANTIARQSR